MGSFSPFTFLRNRELCIPLTQEEMDTFALWPTQVAISMARGMSQVIGKTNTTSFFKLPKKYQCMALTSLNGYGLRGAWQKYKKKQKSKSSNDLVEKVVRLFDCSENEARNYVDFNLINEKKMNILYQRVFEPNTVKIRKKRQNEKGRC